LVFAWDIGKFVGIELTPGNNAKRLVKRKHRFVDRFIGVEGGMVEDTLAAKATYGEMFRTVMAVIIAAAMCRTDRVATMSMLI